MFNKHLRLFLLGYKIILKSSTAEDILRTDVLWFQVLEGKALASVSRKTTKHFQGIRHQTFVKGIDFKLRVSWRVKAFTDHRTSCKCNFSKTIKSCLILFRWCRRSDLKRHTITNMKGLQDKGHTFGLH